MIEISEVFISQRINNISLRNFFAEVLNKFRNELQLLVEQWYQYPKGIDDNPGFNDVFALIERSYVGLFNNAVIRCFPNNAVLQEYSIPLGGGKYVRGDYLVKHWDKNSSVNILFEAKQRPFDGKEYSTEESTVFLAPFIIQGEKYYEAEKEYYEGSTYVSSLIFEWVRYKNQVDQVSSWKNLDDGITDFFCFYHSDVAGLMVYGNLKKVQ